MKEVGFQIPVPQAIVTALDSQFKTIPCFLLLRLLSLFTDTYCLRLIMPSQPQP